MGGAPPSGDLARIRAAASAPAKCILLGEHAVVFGEPCLSVALDLRTTVVARAVGEAFTVNGYAMEPRYHAYFVTARDRVWTDGPPVRFESRTEIPSTSGIGSSAALTVATTAALERLKGDWDPPALARDAYAAEHGAQGMGSPNDTSVSAAGGAVLLAPEKHRAAGIEHLWSIERDDRVWEVHRLDVPEMHLVIGVSGVRGRTVDQVAKVRRFVHKGAFGRETVKEIGGLVWDAVDALRAEDTEALGRLMDRCQADLHTLGVNHPALQRLIEATRRAPGTLGAKLTGAGGGGSIVCLTTDPAAAAAAVRAAGGRAYRVTPAAAGVRAEPDLELDDTLPATGVVPKAAPDGPASGIPQPGDEGYAAPDGEPTRSASHGGTA